MDLDGAENSGAIRKIDVAIHGDTGLVLDQLCRRGSRRKETKEWLATICADETKRREKMLAEIESNDSPPNSAARFVRSSESVFRKTTS